MLLWWILACGGDDAPSTLLEPSDSAVDSGTVAVPSAYDDLDLFVCHPDQESDPCREGLDVTAVAADGSTTFVPHALADAPVADCFYVYPTVSADPTPNADRIDDGPEGFMTQAQAGPYSAACRVIAPLYRQVSLGGLFSSEADRELPYADVLEAFEATVARTDRPFLLIGHSQGTSVLTRLIAERIESDDALHARLVAAHLAGGQVTVPVGQDVGGSFARTPVCRTAEQTGCVVHHVTYQDDNPPGANAIFGIAPAGQEVICTHPGALDSGAGPLNGQLPINAPAYAGAIVGNEVGPYADRTANASIPTSFYSVPGLFSGACVNNGVAHYLEVTVAADPADPRADDVQGDLILPGWGLHLVDIGIVSDQLVGLAARQIAAHGR